MVVNGNVCLFAWTIVVGVYPWENTHWLAHVRPKLSLSRCQCSLPYRVGFWVYSALRFQLANCQNYGLWYDKCATMTCLVIGRAVFIACFHSLWIHLKYKLVNTHTHTMTSSNRPLDRNGNIVKYPSKHGWNVQRWLTTTNLPAY